MESLIVTDHAYKRARERFNWKPDEIKDSATKALLHGDYVPISDIVKEFYGDASTMATYKHKCYIFDADKRLVTCYKKKGN